MELSERRDALNLVCGLAARSVSAAMSCIVGEVVSGASVLGSTGCNAASLSGDLRIPGLNVHARPIVVECDVQKNSWFKQHPLYNLAPFTSRLIAIAIPNRSRPDPHYLVIFCRQGAETKTEVDFPYLSQLAILVSKLLSDQIEVPVDGLNENRGPFELETLNKRQPIGEEAILAFLNKTLPKNVRLRKAGDVSYLAVRKWKANLKEPQLHAFQGLKVTKNYSAASFIAGEIYEAIASTFGKNHFDAIVPVPCGSSGHQSCLCALIADALAIKLNRPVVAALTGELSPGTSHPKKSLRLKPYNLEKSPTGNVLLLDDVATSGQHLRLAGRALSKNAKSVFAVVWIAP